MTRLRDSKPDGSRLRRPACVAVALALGTLALVGFGLDRRTRAVAAAPRSHAITIAVVTHGDGGSFWSVVKRGALDAGRDLGIRVRYSESKNDTQRQARLIDAAVRAHVDGLAVSAPNPDAIAPAAKRADDAGIPVVTLNSGVEHFKELGAFTHVGQTEFGAGQGAGTQLAAAGATKVLCVIHEQSNVGLEQRCDGAATALAGGVERFQVTGSSDEAATRHEL